MWISAGRSANQSIPLPVLDGAPTPPNSRPGNGRDCEAARRTTPTAGSSTRTTTANRSFVRHAYFTGADEPYEKLRKALRAEIDEQAWSSLYSTVSRPFDPPETGKIAVKVINHYGDEVMKVYVV